MSSDLPAIMKGYEVESWLGEEGKEALRKRGELYYPGTERFTEKAVRIAFGNREFYVNWRGI